MKTVRWARCKNEKVVCIGWWHASVDGHKTLCGKTIPLPEECQYTNQLGTFAQYETSGDLKKVTGPNGCSTCRRKINHA